MLPSNSQLYMLDPGDRTTALQRTVRPATRTRLRAVISPRRRTQV